MEIIKLERFFVCFGKLRVNVARFVQKFFPPLWFAWETQILHSLVAAWISRIAHNVSRLVSSFASHVAPKIRRRLHTHSMLIACVRSRSLLLLSFSCVCAILSRVCKQKRDELVRLENFLVLCCLPASCCCCCCTCCDLGARARIALKLVNVCALLFCCNLSYSYELFLRSLTLRFNWNRSLACSHALDSNECNWRVASLP